jgi:hypothetical protein
MDKFLGGLVSGIMVGVIVMMIFANSVTSKFVECRNAQMNGMNIVWQKETPFCMIDIDINGVNKTVTLDKYYEYTK